MDKEKSSVCQVVCRECVHHTIPYGDFHALHSIFYLCNAKAEKKVDCITGEPYEAGIRRCTEHNKDGQCKDWEAKPPLPKTELKPPKEKTSWERFEDWWYYR